MHNLALIVIGWLVLLSAVQAQTPGWEAVETMPLGTQLRINRSITGQLGSVDDTQITIDDRRLRQDVVRRVERVEVAGNRKRNVLIGLLVGGAFGAGASKANGGNAFGMLWAGSLWGGLGAGVGATTGRSSYQVIYQR